MVSKEIILRELREALKLVEDKHNVIIILREVDVFDANNVPRTK